MLEKLSEDYSSLTIAGKIELAIFALWTILLPIISAADYLIDARSGPMTLGSILPQLFTFAMPAIYVALGYIGQKIVHKEISQDRFERASFSSDSSLHRQNKRFDYLIKMGIAAGIVTLLIWSLTIGIMV